MNASLIATGQVVGAYLLGSIPTGLLLARLKGVDIRKVGSGNIGATNVFRSVGKGWGLATFVGDLLKGFLPAFVFPMAGKDGVGPFQGSEMAILLGCAAIIGHNWPVFLGFKGGKGVATSAGVLLGAAPAAMGIGLLVWLAAFLATRYVSVASIAAAVAVTVAGWRLYGAGGRVLPVVLTVLGAVVIARHHGNIRRLFQGTEHRFSFRKKKPEDQPKTKE